MRGLFILLLLVNLAILGWGMQRDPDLSAPQRVAHTGIGNIRLLSELPAAQERVTTTAESSNAEDEPAPEAPAMVEPSAPVPDERQDRASVKEADETPVPNPMEEAAAEDSGVAETESSSGQGPTREVSPAERAELTVDPLLCGAFGPFERGATGREVIDLLKGRGLDASLRRDSLEKPVGYWVLIPPLADRDAAVDKVAQLRQSGITDVRRFVKGEQKDGISLGVFSSRENALRRQKEVSDKGHSSRIVPRTITLPTYWVDYRGNKARVGSAEAELSGRYPEMKNEQYPCSRVVTPGGIF